VGAQGGSARSPRRTHSIRAGLPKDALQGKIMRRILRKIAEDETPASANLAKLADPAVVDDPAEPAETRRARRFRPDRFRVHRTHRFCWTRFAKTAFCRENPCACRPSQTRGIIVPRRC